MNLTYRMQNVVLYKVELPLWNLRRKHLIILISGMNRTKDKALKLYSLGGDLKHNDLPPAASSVV